MCLRWAAGDIAQLADVRKHMTDRHEVHTIAHLCVEELLGDAVPVLQVAAAQEAIAVDVQAAASRN